MSITTEPSNLEYENLEVHVDKCSLRYEQMQEKLNDIDVQFDKIDNRLNRIDERMDRIEIDIKKGNSQIIVGLISAVATIIAAFVGVIVVVL